MSEIAFTYDVTKDPQYQPEIRFEPAYIVGVPLRDLTIDEFNALSERFKRAVVAAPYYVATTATGVVPPVDDAPVAAPKKKRG